MKRLMLILIPVVLLGVGVGLVLTGIIYVPGISPSRKGPYDLILKEIYKKYGKVNKDLVTLKGAPKAELEKFAVAAKAAEYKPIVSAEGVRSESLAAMLSKEKPPGEAKPKSVASVAPPPTAPKPKPKLPVEEVKPEIGIAKVADLWNDIEIAKLQLIVNQYKDEDLAKILLKMDSEHVAELLSKIDSKRAAKLSLAMQKVASIVPISPSDKG